VNPFAVDAALLYSAEVPQQETSENELGHCDSVDSFGDVDVVGNDPRHVRTDAPEWKKSLGENNEQKTKQTKNKVEKEDEQRNQAVQSTKKRKTTFKKRDGPMRPSKSAQQGRTR
jgi:hypothetical protein